MTGHVNAYRRYLTLGGRDVEDMLRVAGTDPRPYRDAMQAVLEGRQKAGDAIFSVLRREGIRRPLFPRKGVRILAENVPQVSHGLAAIRLCSWYRRMMESPESMPTECDPLDAGRYVDLCQFLYGDTYVDPVQLSNPADRKLLDGMFQLLLDRLEGDVELARNDSHGPEGSALMFASSDAAFVLNRLAHYDLFCHPDTMLVLEAMRRAAAPYGCVMALGGASLDDVQYWGRLYREDDNAAKEKVRSCLAFVDL